jgi:hypothetical protein
MNISFGQPVFLWGLLSIGVPIWLHFINKKSTSTLFFSDIRVLKGTPAQGKGFRVLYDLVLLLIRILALVALILAFAQPKKEGLLNDKSTATYLFVDNHVGLMEGNRAGFNALSAEMPRSKKPVFLLLNSFQNAEFDFKTWNDLHDLWPSLKMSEQVDHVKSIIDRIGQIHSEQNAGSNLNIIWVSDFPRSRPWPVFPKNFEVRLVPVKSLSLANVVVDSISTNANQVQIGRPFNLKVRIKNIGNLTAKDQKMSLFVDDFPISMEKINLKVGEAKWLDFGLSLADKKEIKVKLISDDPVLFDNVYSFMLAIPESKDVYVLEGMSGEKYMSTVFSNDSLFDFHLMNRQSLVANLNKMRGFLILNELNGFSVDALKLISNWVKMGNTVVFIPSAQLNNGVVNLLNSYFSSQGNSFKQEISNQALAVRLPIKHARFFNSILEESSFKKNLEMFNSNSYLQWNGGLPIFEYANGKPFLSQFKLGSGSMYVFSGDIAKQSDSFFKHGLFLPVFQEMALYTSFNHWSTTIFSNTFEIVAPKDITWSTSEKELVTLVKGRQSWIPEQKWTGTQWICHWPDLLDRNFSGFWQVKIRDKKTLNLAVNYPLMESEMRNYTRAEIQNHYRGKQHIQVSSMKDIPLGDEVDSDLSFYFFIAALCFFLIEMAIIFCNRLNIIPERRK